MKEQKANKLVGWYMEHRKLEAGEKAVFTCSSDIDNIHTVIRKWNGVVKVGIDDDIDECFVYADDELIFEEGCIYRAEITIYPEITYYFDENIEVNLEGIILQHSLGDIYEMAFMEQKYI